MKIFDIMQPMKCKHWNEVRLSPNAMKESNQSKVKDFSYISFSSWDFITLCDLAIVRSEKEIYESLQNYMLQASWLVKNLSFIALVN